MLKKLFFFVEGENYVVTGLNGGRLNICSALLVIKISLALKFYNDELNIILID